MTLEDDDLVDTESILAEARGAGLPALDLRWHYRSRHEALIAFSNQRYYDARLVTFPAPVPPAAITTVDVPLHGLSLDEALAVLGYRALYDVLTAQARVRLGLIRGYKLALDIEKCSGIEELRALARRFVADLEANQGVASANALRIALGAET